MRLQTLPILLAPTMIAANQPEITHYYLVKQNTPRHKARTKFDPLTTQPCAFSQASFKRSLGSNTLNNHIYQDIENASKLYDAPFTATTTDFLRTGIIPHERPVDYNIFSISNNIEIASPDNRCVSPRTQTVLVNTEKDVKLRRFVGEFAMACNGKSFQEKIELLSQFTQSFFKLDQKTSAPQPNSEPVLLGEVDTPNSFHYALLAKVLADHVDGLSCKIISGTLNNTPNKRHVWNEVIASDASYNQQISGFKDDLVQASPETIASLFKQMNDRKTSHEPGDMFMLDASLERLIRFETEVPTTRPTWPELGTVLTWQKVQPSPTDAASLSQYGSWTVFKAKDTAENLRQQIYKSFENNSDISPQQRSEVIDNIKRQLTDLEQTPYYDVKNLD
jgi:hypothetical protein